MRLYIRLQRQGYFRPKVNFARSAQRFWSRALPLQVVCDDFDFTIDNKVNQTVKKALLLALQIARQVPQLSPQVKSLSQSLIRLNQVSDRSISELLSWSPDTVAQVPTFRQDYLELLKNSVDMLLNVDVHLKKGDPDTSLSSFTISLEEVFERYLLNVLRYIDSPGSGAITAKDGNDKKNEKPLFFDNPRFVTRPDLIITQNHKTKIIADAKYKIRPSEDDRYQIISHALSHGAKRALLIYPKPETGKARGIHRLGFIGSPVDNIDVYEYYFDLSGDLDKEEAWLRSTIQQLTV